jgi:hypothetical protein
MSRPSLMHIVNDVLDFSKVNRKIRIAYGRSKSVSIDASGY